MSLGGLELSRCGLEAAVELCRERVVRRDGGYVCFVNGHTLTEAAHDPALAAALCGATFRFADGAPLVWLSRVVEQPIENRVAGPDFTAALMHATRDQPHGLIGGLPGRADEVARRVGIQAVTYSPPMRGFSAEAAREDWSAFLARCPGGRSPAIVWLGLGAPKQERWLEAIAPLEPSVLFLGVGAAFDFLAGVKPRAPRWMQRSGLEWLHRMATDRRLVPRYARANSRLAVLAGRLALQRLGISGSRPG